MWWIGWLLLIGVILVIYLPAIHFLGGLGSCVLLILAPLLPWVLGVSFSVSSFEAGVGFTGMFLWGSIVASVRPGPGGAPVVTPEAPIALVLIMVLLVAGGVLGFLGGRNRKFFLVGGISGVTAVLVYLIYVGTTGGWSLLFSAGAGGFCTLSIGFFVGIISSVDLILAFFEPKPKRRQTGGRDNEE